MSITAKQVQEAVEAWRESEDYSGWGNPWGSIHANDFDVIPGLENMSFVESFGGEGEGDSAGVVFKVGDQLFQVDAYYASYDGFTWDSEPYEVEAYEKTETAYRPK